MASASALNFEKKRHNQEVKVKISRKARKKTSMKRHARVYNIQFKKERKVKQGSSCLEGHRHLMAGKFDMQIILSGFEQILDGASKSSSHFFFFLFCFVNMMEGTRFGLFDR